MPSITILPENIDLLDFSAGWLPDLSPQGVPANGLLDVNNLLPDRATGALKTRAGTARFSDLRSANAALEDFEVRALHPFNRNSGDTNELGQQYLIAVVRKKPKPNPREVNDIRLYAIDVQAGTSARIDHAGRIWRHYGSAHWGETIDSFYYGGSELDPLYSYKPKFKDGTTNPEPFEADASMGQWCSTTWATATAYSVGDRRWDTVAEETLSGGLRERTYVFICTTAHTSSAVNRPGTEIRYDADGVEIGIKGRSRDNNKWENQGRYLTLWANATTYLVGDKVSYFVNDSALGYKYPRYYATANQKSTFICVREHTSATGTNEPPSNAWEPYRAPISNVACWHGSRLFIRDGDAGSGRLRYGGLVTADGFWDPTDWDSDDVQGAGWMDIASGDGDDIRALASLGQYLIIAKRRSTWALSGLNPSTWSLRQIGDKGCLYKNAICQHEGSVYFFSDEGFFVTDGAIVQEVEGGVHIRDWIHDNVDLEENNIYKMSMVSFMGFIWLCLPAGDAVARANTTLVYDPATASFWKLDINAYDFAVNRVNRMDELFFAQGVKPALIMRYKPTSATYLDDTGVATPATREIPWMARTAWFTFGPWKEQRRIRRLWVRVRTAAANSITIKYFRDYATSSFKTVTRTTTTAPMSTVEGEAVRDIDPSAISLEISGTKAEAALVSVAMQTQLRRMRYNRGVRA